MGGHLNSPNEADLILDLPEDKFFYFVGAFISEDIYQAQAMRVIAYQNYEVMMKVSAKIAEQDASIGAPVDIEDHIRVLAKLKQDNKTDEFGIRRLSWFLEAAVLKLAEKKAAGNAAQLDLLADIWIKIAEGCSCLSDVIKNNRLWSDDEKSWYEFVKTEKDGIQHCLQWVLPLEIFESEKISNYAIGRDIFLISRELNDD